MHTAYSAISAAILRGAHYALPGGVLRQLLLRLMYDPRVVSASIQIHTASLSQALFLEYLCWQLMINIIRMSCFAYGFCIFMFEEHLS